jgi:hypothetical protein
MSTQASKCSVAMAVYVYSYSRYLVITKVMIVATYRLNYGFFFLATFFARSGKVKIQGINSQPAGAT